MKGNAETRSQHKYELNFNNGSHPLPVRMQDKGDLVECISVRGSHPQAQY
jgi:hypothetical protein